MKEVSVNRLPRGGVLDRVVSLVCEESGADETLEAPNVLSQAVSLDIIGVLVQIPGQSAARLVRLTNVQVMQLLLNA